MRVSLAIVTQARIFPLYFAGRLVDRASMPARLLISGGGTGASNNVIRSLRAGDPSLSIAAWHADRFLVKKSAADRRYLLPAPSHAAFPRALRRLVRAEQ